MNKLAVMIFVALVSLSLPAQCRPGYQLATVLKVLDSSSPPTRHPAPADEPSEESITASGQTVILRGGSKRYEYRVLRGPASKPQTFTIGQVFCVGTAEHAIHIMTLDGTTLPGIAQHFPSLPRTSQ